MFVPNMHLELKISPWNFGHCQVAFSLLHLMPTIQQQYLLHSLFTQQQKGSLGLVSHVVKEPFFGAIEMPLVIMPKPGW